MRLALFSLFLFATLTSSLPAGEPEGAPERQKLVGQWRYQDEINNQIAHYQFRPDGTFTGELRHNAEVVRKFEGRWTVENGMILYTYDKDSMNQVGGGARERDRLLRIDDSSYTIEAGDGGQRTYWRVKDKS